MVNFNEAIEDIRDNNGFRSNNREDSYYRTYNLQNSKPIQVRISNHGTHLWTWVDRDYNPTHAINICIVFSENGNHNSNVVVDMNIKQNKQGKTVVVGERQPFEVMQYVYDCQSLDINDVALINATIQNTPQNGIFKDPLANTPKHAKVYRLTPNQAIETIVENKGYKTNRKMKQTIKLNETDLHRLIKESVRQVLKESYNDSQTVSKIRDLRPKITSFIEYLEDKYDELGSGNDFLDRVYNSAYNLESDLLSFLRDNNEQQIYQY